jgi:hypothetical protein
MVTYEIQKLLFLFMYNTLEKNAQFYQWHNRDTPLLAEFCQVGVTELARGPLRVMVCELKRHPNKTCSFILSTVISYLSQYSSAFLLPSFCAI